MNHTYRSHCHVDGCDMRFIGISRGEYLAHLRDEHGDEVADIYDKLVCNRCPECGTVFKTEDGLCPSCGQTGVFQDELLEVASDVE